MTCCCLQASVGTHLWGVARLRGFEVGVTGLTVGTGIALEVEKNLEHCKNVIMLFKCMCMQLTALHASETAAHSA